MLMNIRGNDEFWSWCQYFIIKCLTDNVNRTVGYIRAAFNKVNKSLGVTNSVAYNYDYLAVISFKSDKEEEIFEAILNEGIDLVDFESENGEITISANQPLIRSKMF